MLVRFIKNVRRRFCLKHFVFRFFLMMRSAGVTQLIVRYFWRTWIDNLLGWSPFLLLGRGIIYSSNSQEFKTLILSFPVPAQ